MILMRRLVLVDGKVRTQLRFPAGYQDVISIGKTDEYFRLLYDVKGRFVLHRITSEEGQYKLLRVQKVMGHTSGAHNPFGKGQQRAIPAIQTHDGRNIRYPNPDIKVNDTIKWDIKNGQVSGHIKFEVGNLAMCTRGSNVGRVGRITAKDSHPGSFDIIHLKDTKGNKFSTRLANVFIIGEGEVAWISLPKQKGVKLSILEEKEAREEAKKTGKTISSVAEALAGVDEKDSKGKEGKEGKETKEKKGKAKGKEGKEGKEKKEKKEKGKDQGKEKGKDQGKEKGKDQGKEKGKGKGKDGKPKGQKKQQQTDSAPMDTNVATATPITGLDT